MLAEDQMVRASRFFIVRAAWFDFKLVSLRYIICLTNFIPILRVPAKHQPIAGTDAPALVTLLDVVVTAYPNKWLRVILGNPIKNRTHAARCPLHPQQTPVHFKPLRAS